MKNVLTFLLISTLFSFLNAQSKKQENLISCGIADLDRIRINVRQSATNSTNFLSRSAALHRFWRLLWSQGYNMNFKNYNSKWDAVLSSGGTVAHKALDQAYLALDDILKNGVFIPEVLGDNSSTKNTSKTNWPGYHGTNGKQDGFSPDSGPSKGKIAWKVAKGNFWYAKPVIENGKVYTASPGSDVFAYCLDEKTGKVIWNSRQYGTQIYHTPGSIFTPVLSKNKVLFSTGWWQQQNHFIVNKQTGSIETQLNAGQISNESKIEKELFVHKFNNWNFILADAASGKGIWQFYSGGYLAGEPVLSDDKVYAARQSGIVYSFNTSSSKPTWQVNLNTQLRGTAGVGQNSLYLGDKSGKLHALNKSDGSKKWTFEVQTDELENRAYQFYSTAIESEDGKKVYLGAASKFIYCLDSSNGKLIWKHKLSDWIRSRPLIIGETIYAATLDAKLYALIENGNSVEEKWQAQLGEHGFTADLNGNENGILAGGMDLILYSVSPKTGKVQWKHSLIDAAWINGKRHHADVFAGQYQASPAIVDDIAYVGGPDGFLNAHDVKTGKFLWRFEARGRISATPCIAEGKIFIGQNGRYMEYYAIDQKTGQPIWQIDNLDWATVGGTAYKNGKIFLGGESGNFFAINAEDGKITWKNKSKIPSKGFQPPPAVDDTKVYTGSHDGRYYAFNQNDGSTAWSIDTSVTPDKYSGGNPDSAGIVLWKDLLYIQKRGDRIAALKRDSGKVIWEWKQPKFYLQNGAVAAYNNRVFGSVVRDVTSIPFLARIYAFSDAYSGGKELWSYDEAGGGGGLTAPVLTKDKLMFGSSAGVFMTCLDPNTGKLIWRCYVGGPMEEAVPAIYGNKVFSHHRNGYFFAIE